MKDIIIDHLNRIEKKHNVKILLAIESGSRAWGFPSGNSDYDVRFIYVHKKDWYLTVDRKKDVIELPVDEVLDINGWDLRKSLQLLKKSNPVMFEWLSSPIRYCFHNTLVEPLIDLSKKAFLPISSCHHYLSMSKKTFSDIGSERKVRIKNYLYALRTVLCCRWIIEKSNQPPMLISDLLSELVHDNNLSREIENLIRLREKSTEKDVIEKSPVIEDYLQQQLSRLPDEIPGNQSKLPGEDFDIVFREILDMAGN